jgi:hypothetical protein
MKEVEESTLSWKKILGRDYRCPAGHLRLRTFPSTLSIRRGWVDIHDYEGACHG